MMNRIKRFAHQIGDRVLPIVKSAKFKRYLPLVIVLLVAVGSVATCMSHTPAPPDPEPTEPAISDPTPTVTAPTPPPSPTPTPSPDPSPEISPEPEPEPEPGPFNPLTGLPTETDLSGNRPLAIMINNIGAAQPQLGISKADIIYECLAEGGVTRMLAIFQDVTDIGTIGSVRSARPYYVDFAQSYDAIYIHAGGSEQAYTIMRDRNITRLDGVNGTQQPSIFYRDPNRSHMAVEHRLVTSGSKITDCLPTYGFRLGLAEGYKRALSFTEDGTPENGKPATEFTVNYISSKSTSFKFEPDDGLYYLRQKMRGFNGPYRDGNDNTQISVTNVIILYMSVSRIDSVGRLKITTTGNGPGHFICGGEYTEINWSRENDESQFMYTHSDGSELMLGQGKTFICIVPNDVEIDFS